jgi:nucleoside-diphosphate-sugar epimerase
MRILVTGASGFAGSLLVPRLLSGGHSVRALGRDPARVSAALAAVAVSGAGTPGERARRDREHREIATNLTSDLATEVEILRGDALSGEGLAAALAGVEVAYYLIHSMERPAGEAVPFDERDRIAARNFAGAAARAGVARIVYLGGLLPRAGAASPHLASRDEVERICSPPSPTRSPCAPRS